MPTDRLIARLMPKGNQLPRWREGKYPGHEYTGMWMKVEVEANLDRAYSSII